MELIFVHGPPACGKLTVATELAAVSSYRLFHNHLTVDLATALFDFGTEPFAHLRETIWLESFRTAARHGTSLVFTFNPESTVSPDFPSRARELVASEGGRVWFVELTCSEAHLEERIENESRGRFGKLRSLERYRELRDSGAFEYPPLPEPIVAIDTGSTSPRDAAREVLARINAAAQRLASAGPP